MFKVNEQQLFYLLLIAAAGFFLTMASTISSNMGVPGDPGAGFLPQAICVLIILLVGYLLVMETFFQEAAGELKRLTRHELIALTVTMVAIVGFLVSLAFFGFFASTLVFLFLFRLVTDKLIKGGRPNVKSVSASALYALLATSFIYLVFSVLFELSLP